MVTQNDWSSATIRKIRRLPDVQIASCYLVEDEKSGDRAIHRSLPISLLSKNARLRFESKSATLAGLDSELVSSPLRHWTSEHDANVVYHDYQLPTLLRRLLAGPIADTNVLTLGCGLLEAIDLVHAEGVLLRDIRPSQIWLKADWSPVLAGFGPMWLGRQLSDRNEVGFEFASHVSPELAGALQHKIGPSSDLYSVGVLLFTALSGTTPFSGANLGELIRQHLNDQPDFSLMPSSVPMSIVDVVDRLMQKEPQDRYQTAASALFDLRSIQAATNSGQRTRRIAIGTTDLRSELTESSFVGRTSELKVLDDSLIQVAEGIGQRLFIGSHVGSGKTRFLDEAVRLAVRRDFDVYRVQAGLSSSEMALESEQTRDEPCSSLRQIAFEVCKKAKSNPSLRIRVEKKLSRHRVVAAATMPGLAAEFEWDVDHEPTLAPQDSKLHQNTESPSLVEVARMFRGLLASLAAIDEPALVCIDDCHCLDSKALEVFAEVAASRLPNLLLIFAANNDWDSGSVGQPDQLIDRLDVDFQLHLRPLDNPAIREFSESSAGQLPAPAIRTIQTYAEGSPFKAAAILCGLVEGAALVPKKGGGWRLDEKKLADFQAADDVTALLLKNIDKILPETRYVLSVAAVHGSRFEIEAIREMLPLDVLEIREHLRRASDLCLIWNENNDRHRFVHDRVRQSLLDDIPEKQCRSIHEQIADSIGEKHPERVLEIAHHYHAANLDRKALIPALEAANLARSQYDLVRAEAQLTIAIRAVDKSERRVRHELSLELGEVLMLQGRYDDAQLWFDSAELCLGDADKLDLAKLRGSQGELAYKRGLVHEAINLQEQVLYLLGHRKCPPQKTQRAVTSLLMEMRHRLLKFRLVDKLRRLFEREPSHAARLAMRTYHRLSWCHWHTGDSWATLWYHLRGINFSDRFSASCERSRLYSDHAPMMSLLGVKRWSDADDRRSAATQGLVNDLSFEGQSCCLRSVWLYASAEFEKAIEQVRKAIEILGKTGDHWETQVARTQLPASLYRLGELQPAIQESIELYDSALANEDFQLTSSIVEVWARASLGAIPVHIIEEELARRPTNAHRTAQLQLALGVKHFYDNRFSNARNEFGKAIDLLQKSGVRNAYVSSLYPWYCSAMRRQIETRVYRSERVRKRDIRMLKRRAKTALKIAQKFPGELPHAWREYAAACGIGGDEAKSKKAFDHSLKIAFEQGASFEYAQTLRLSAEFGAELHWPEADRQLDEANELLDGFRLAILDNSEESPSLVDRFDSLLNSGRRILAAQSPEKSQEATMEAARELLRGERTSLINCRSLDPRNWESDEPFDRDLVAEVIRRRIPMVTTVEETIHHGIPIQKRGSFLCGPITENDRIVACIYASNSRIEGFFGDDELRIAEYLCSAAGVALEKATGFKQLQTLNANLEKTVSARTAAVVQRSLDLESLANELINAKDNLRSAKEAAEAANQAKSNFLARMSHEIRTPLTAVLGFTEILLRRVAGETKEDHRTYLETIHTNGLHLLQLLNDLLDISKIEADKLETESIDCNLLRIVADVTKGLSSQAVEKELDLSIQISGPIPKSIVSDPTRLRQILTNLIGNAIKFTESGRVTINLRIEKSPANASERVRISVEDSGIGMSEEQLKRIFDPFAQADTSTTRRFGGTGLGLSISKKLAKALRGTLEVASTPHVGSCFSITLPFDREIAVMLDEESAYSIVSSEELYQWKPKNLEGISVLVVDDAETNRELLTLVLQEASVNVTTEVNGQRAIEEIEKNGNFDVILMDMQMPVLDGYSAAKELRRRGNRLPIIALTANSMLGDEAKCRTSGCSDYLSKPIDVDQVLEKVKHWAHRDGTLGPHSTIKGSSDVASSQSLPGDVCETGNASASPSTSSSSLVRVPVGRFRPLAAKFVNKMSDEIVALHSAIESEDFELLAQRGHWLRGSAGSLGLNRLEQIGLDLEHAAKVKDENQILSAIQAATSETDLARLELASD